MPYIRQKPKQDFLGFIAPGKEHLFVDATVSRPVATCAAAGRHGRFQRPSTATREELVGDFAAMPWAVSDSFIEEFRSCSDARQLLKLNTRLNVILNHIERRGVLPTQVHNDDEESVQRVVQYWLDLLALCDCSSAVEEECLCVLVYLLSKTPLSSHRLLVQGELRLLHECLTWMAVCDPANWQEEVSPIIISLRSQILEMMARRLHCRYLLSHLSSRNYWQLSRFHRVFLKDGGKERWTSDIRPVRLCLALSILAETLKVCSEQASSQQGPSPIQPLLLHALIAWHCGQTASVQPHLLAESLEKTVDWTYSLCSGVCLRSPPPSWLQDNFALELLGELAFHSSSTLNALQTIASLPLPDFAFEVLKDGNLGSKAARAYTLKMSAVCYWRWQHVATYIDSLKRISKLVTAPQLRVAAFSGPSHWSPVSSGKKQTPSQQEASRQEAIHTTPVITTDRKALLRNSTVSLTGLLAFESWLGSGTQSLIQPLLGEAFECITSKAEADDDASPTNRSTMASPASLHGPCQVAMRRCKPPFQPSTLESRLAGIGKPPQRIPLTYSARSSLNSTLADVLLRKLLPLTIKKPSGRRSRLSVDDLLSSSPVTSSGGSAQSSADQTTSKQQDKRVSPGAKPTPSTELPERPKVNFTAKVEPRRHLARRQSGSPSFQSRNLIALRAITDVYWKEEIPELDFKIRLGLCDDDGVPAPPPSLDGDKQRRPPSLSELLTME